MVVRGGHAGILRRNFIERSLPQVSRKGEHIGLVHERHVMSTRDRKLERVTNRTLGTHARVDRTLGGNLVGCALAQHAALADIGAFGVFANDNEVMRKCSARCRSFEWTLVHIEIKLKTHLQQ